METTLPNSIQIVKSVEIFSRGNVLSLFYAGTNDAMYKYSGAIFGISALTLTVFVSGFAPHGRQRQNWHKHGCYKLAGINR